MDGNDKGHQYPIQEEIIRQQTIQNQARRRTRHNSLSPVNQDKYLDIFNKIDRDNDGLIDKREIINELETKPQDITYKDIKLIQPEPKESPIGHGGGSFKDGIFIRKTRKAREKQAQQIVSNVDSDGDGKITENEFIDLMHENSKVAAEYFNMLDTDSDGILTIQDIIHHPELTKLDLSTQEALSLLRRKLEPAYFDDHLKNDEFQITRREFIDAHIEELIILQKFEDARDNSIFNWREMNSLIDYEAAPVAKKFQYETFLMGGVAGAISRTVTAPIDRLKIFFQVHHQSPQAGYGNTLKFMIKEGGLKSLWRGNGINVLKIIPEQATKYGLFEHIKSNFCDENPTNMQRFFAGATAGAVSQTIIYPMEVIKTRMVLRATGQYSNSFDLIRQVYRQEGLRSFGRGYIPTVIGIFPYAGLDLFFAETARKYIQNTQSWAVNSDGNLRPLIPFAIGGASSATAGFIVYPINLIKTKMQAMRPKDFEELGSPKSEKAPFVRQIVYEIRRTSGFRGFYSGIQANLLKGVLASSISFGIWENLKNLINYKSK